ncbi:hypothetical protein AVEN_41017-1 [Araneus ventricosus]|uniref:Uncharacterized protein n=1 Tax=Araneus ventricosus TaxID=182803 RepID=A0A4Y2TCH7_ARAVE|nr:hypothetical protein AVEN_41017-1 [Araneus ventricosus]
MKCESSSQAEAPDLLKQCTNSQVAKTSTANSREYNAALAFALMGAEAKAPLKEQPYSSIYMVQIYHMFPLSVQMNESDIALQTIAYYI